MRVDTIAQPLLYEVLRVGQWSSGQLLAFHQTWLAHPVSELIEACVFVLSGLDRSQLSRPWKKSYYEVDS